MTEPAIAPSVASNESRPVRWRGSVGLTLCVAPLCALPLLAANLWLVWDVTRGFTRSPPVDVSTMLPLVWFWSAAVLPFGSLLPLVVALREKQYFDRNLARLRWGRALLFAAITVTPLFPLAIFLGFSLASRTVRWIWSAGIALLDREWPHLASTDALLALRFSVPVWIWLGLA